MFWQFIIICTTIIDINRVKSFDSTTLEGNIEVIQDDVLHNVKKMHNMWTTEKRPCLLPL